jgi:hypothetical protein
MGWKDLLQAKDETVVLPWLGGRSLRSGPRGWNIKGQLPDEHGWYTFRIEHRNAHLHRELPAEDKKLLFLTTGYLVGDRFVPDNVRVEADPAKIHTAAEVTHLIEPGLDRFVRIQVGRSHEDGPLIYDSLAFPLGPEEEVLQAFLDEQPNVDNVKGVPPALDAAFRMETWHRAEAEKRRLELERQHREEEERRLREERRQALFKQLGDAQGRRDMAREDFPAAARAALAVGGATYLDSRPSAHRGEMVVRFRFLNRRFECVCQAHSLRIIDSGICLIDHATEERGDTFFTLESLPGVINQANREGRLVVFRHA